MADDQRHVLASAVDAAQAVKTATVVDAEEFDRARLDERWRQFCRDADRYVAATTSGA